MYKIGKDENLGIIVNACSFWAAQYLTAKYTGRRFPDVVSTSIDQRRFDLRFRPEIDVVSMSITTLNGSRFDVDMLTGFLFVPFLRIEYWNALFDNILACDNHG